MIYDTLTIMKKRRTKLFVFLGIALFLVIPTLLSIGTTRPIAEIPFTRKGNHIFVTATVNGLTGTYVIDTGIGPFLVTRRPPWGLEPTDIKVDGFFLLGKYSKPDVYRTDSIKLGNVAINGDFLVVHRADLHDPDIDGIVGLPAFRGYFVEIAYSQNKIRIYRERPRQYEKSVPVEFVDGVYPIIQCYVDGLSVPFWIDTGFDGNILFPLPEAKTIPEDKYVRIINEFGRPYYRLALDSVDCRLEKFEGVTGYTNIAGPADYSPLFARWGILGGDFLRRFDILLDCRGSTKALLYYKRVNPLYRLYLRNGMTPWNLNGRANARFSEYGIDGWRQEGEAFVVTSIVEGGVAHANGIACGTRIARINGRPVSKYTKRKAEDAFLFSEKPLTLTVLEADGSERDVRLTIAK